MIKENNKLKECILGCIVGVFLLGAAYSIGILIVELRSKETRTPSNLFYRNFSDLPSDESDLNLTSPHTADPNPLDKRLGILVDIESLPNRTKLNGYGSFIGYRSLPNTTSIDRFIYCQNFDESTLTVNSTLSRYDAASPKRFPCVRFEINDLMKGVNLIEFLGIQALRLKLDSKFNANTGGILSISFLSKPITYREMNLSIRKNEKGIFVVETLNKKAFNQLALEFRGSSFVTGGFPAGLLTMSLKKDGQLLQKLNVDTDLPKRP